LAIIYDPEKTTNHTGEVLLKFFRLFLIQDENHYDDDSYRGNGESSVQINYPCWDGEERECEGLVEVRLEIAMIEIEVVCAFSCGPAYVPA